MSWIVEECKCITISDDKKWSEFYCYPNNQINITITTYNEGYLYSPCLVKISVADNVSKIFEFNHVCANKNDAFSKYEHFKTYIYNKLSGNVDVDWFFEH